MDRHKVTVIIPDKKKKGRERNTGPWACFHGEICRANLWIMSCKCCKWKQPGLGLVGCCPGIFPSAHYCRKRVRLGQPMWRPLPWQQQSRQAMSCIIFQQTNSIQFKQIQSLGCKQGVSACRQAGEGWYYRNKLLWDHQLSMQISL